MHRPGDSLRQERETRGRTIEEMAAATGIRPDLLTALEQDAFDSLPGRGFGKLYIRAYAEVLGFDPRPVIEAYDGAVRDREAAEPAAATAEAPRPVNALLARLRQERIAGRVAADFSEEPEEESEASDDLVEAMPDPPPRQEAVSTARSPRWALAALLLLVPLSLVAWSVFSGSAPVAPPVAERQEVVAAETAAEAPSRPPGQDAVDPAPAPVQAAIIQPAAAQPDRTRPSPDRAAASSSLRVAESGVGLRVAGGRLEGEGDRFRAGQRVSFATRVLGGEAGESIRHVWMRDGTVEQSIPLRLGSASWRTHSTKTLGRPGAWVVEARDAHGRVLARAELLVEP